MGGIVDDAGALEVVPRALGSIVGHARALGGNVDEVRALWGM